MDHPPRLPLYVIQAAVAEFFGLQGIYTALDGERDQNHKLTNANGAWVVKLCNPGEGAAIVEAQLLALEHIHKIDPTLPVPRVLRCTNGDAFCLLKHDGSSYPLVVLTWRDGSVIGLAQLTGEHYCNLGEVIGRLNRSLRGFVHSAVAARALIWNTVSAHRLLKHVDVLDQAQQELVCQVLTAHAEHVAPRLPALPAQILHGDVHPYNALMDAHGHVSGIIDFGDMIHAPRVIELSNAIADCLVPGGDLAGSIGGLVKGFVRHVPLEKGEVDLVLPLIRSRLALTSIITALRRTENSIISPQIAALDGHSLDLLVALQGPDLEKIIHYAANLSIGSDSPVSGLLDRRRAAMGPRPLLFYDDPLHIVSGKGVWLTAADGRHYLDCYNNVAHVGHAHPYVAAAVERQLRALNTNTRYLTVEAVNYAERLKATLDPSLDTVIFVNSGSEANDVASRMACCWTGNFGILVMDFAYHGVTDISDAMSPSNYPAGKFAKPNVRQLQSPDVFRGPFRTGAKNTAEHYAASADVEIASLAAAGHGLALTIIDSAFMTNGIVDAPPGYVKAIASRTRAAGGLFVADEVQSGFGRMGTDFWGHQRHRVVPDFVTIGKPAGNGYPIGAIITRAEILAKFTSETGPFFSTFGGGNAACAAGLAVLDVIAHENLLHNAREVGDHFRAGLLQLKRKHALIGDVRGSGLAIGVELVGDHTTLAPAQQETRQVVNALRHEGILLGSEGKRGNVLKIRPPLVFQKADADVALAALDRVLSRVAP
jgi:4-aminobutyrate aminotransferase-like enzyme/Ser/Thr protein kinase RdoA (MazF antagonist)